MLRIGRLGGGSWGPLPLFVADVTFIAAIVIPIAVWMAVAWETRGQTLDAARVAEAQTNSAVARYMERVFATQAQALDLIRFEAGDRSCQQLRADPHFQTFMTTAASHTSGKAAIWLIDADGLMCLSSDPSRMDSSSRAFRDYFSAARRLAPGRFFVDKAVIGRVDGLPVFNIAARRGNEGEFLGVVVAAVDLNELATAWDAMFPGRHILVVRQDGAEVARSWRPLVPEKDAAVQAPIAEVMRSGKTDTFMEKANSDGSTTLSTWTWLPEWGVLVGNSVPEADVLIPWRQSSLLYGAIAGLAAAALGGLSAFLRISQRRLLIATNELMNRLELDRARAQELQDTQVRLAQAEKLSSLGQLAGGIAHDFNNVLQAVQGSLALIERRRHDPEKVRSLARMANEAARRGAAITGRLLSFARRDALQTEVIDIESLLEGVQEMLTHTLGAGIDVKVTVEPGAPRLLADKAQLETALINLATNARDAMQGHGVLRFSAAGDQGSPELAASGKTYVRIAVVDSGVGMPPEVLARAREPFYTTKGVGRGTGLGLAMVGGFAEQSGGAMKIESAPGQGATVTLWFPAAEGGAAAAPSDESAPAPSAGEERARLLIVDDDPAVRETLAQEMEAEGFFVLAAADGPEALAHLDAGEDVDLMVTDLSMPGFDGVTLIREAQKRRPHLPVILLTGFATAAAESALGGATGGAFVLLRKPVDTRNLMDQAAVLLAGAKPRVAAAPKGGV